MINYAKTVISASVAPFKPTRDQIQEAETNLRNVLATNNMAELEIELQTEKEYAKILEAYSNTVDFKEEIKSKKHQTIVYTRKIPVLS